MRNHVDEYSFLNNFKDVNYIIKTRDSILSKESYSIFTKNNFFIKSRERWFFENPPKKY